MFPIDLEAAGTLDFSVLHLCPSRRPVDNWRAGWWIGTGTKERQSGGNIGTGTTRWEYRDGTTLGGNITCADMLIQYISIGTGTQRGRVEVTLAPAPPGGNIVMEPHLVAT